MEEDLTLPICALCAKSGVLCNACEAKLQEGKISGLDVELAKILYKIGEGGLGFERGIDTKNFIIILAKKDQVGKIIGKGGKNIKLLSKKFKKPVRVIGTDSLQKMVYDFVYPAKILGIGLVYEEDGSTRYKVTIDKRDKNKLRMNIGEIKEIISSISDSEIAISLE